MLQELADIYGYIVYNTLYIEGGFKYAKTRGKTSLGGIDVKKILL